MTLNGVLIFATYGTICALSAGVYLIMKGIGK
jgi:hypothetical protein